MSRLALALVLVAASATSCKNNAPPASQPTIRIDEVPGHDTVLQDNTPKEAPRLVPAEAYMRTFLSVFGYLSPVEMQLREFPANANNQLFDTWNQYLLALGLPNYAADIPRAEETNLIMVAAFERIGIALCDRALEKDLKANTPVDKRRVYAFDVPPSDPKVPTSGLVDLTAFAPRFDVLHLTFLGYPAALAPTDRVQRFFDVYKQVAAKHDAAKSKFTNSEAGWAAVCYGLVRHPEFHLY